MGRGWSNVPAKRGQRLPLISKGWKSLEDVTITYELGIKEVEAYRFSRAGSRRVPRNRKCPACGVFVESESKTSWVLRRDVVPVCRKCWALGVKVECDSISEIVLREKIKVARQLYKELMDKMKGRKVRSEERKDFKRYRELIKQCPGLICPDCGEKKQIQLPKVEGENRAIVGRGWVSTGGRWRCRSCWNKERHKVNG